MGRPNAVEKEVDAIRAKLYEEIKGMSSAEMHTYMDTKIASLEKKFGIQPISKEEALAFKAGARIHKVAL